MIARFGIFGLAMADKLFGSAGRTRSCSPCHHYDLHVQRPRGVPWIDGVDRIHFGSDNGEIIAVVATRVKSVHSGMRQYFTYAFH